MKHSMEKSHDFFQLFSETPRALIFPPFGQPIIFGSGMEGVAERRSRLVLFHDKLNTMTIARRANTHTHGKHNVREIVERA